MFKGIDPLLWVLFVLAWLLVPVVYWARKRQQHRLRKWAREDLELMKRWEKELGIGQ